MKNLSCPHCHQHLKKRFLRRCTHCGMAIRMYSRNPVGWYLLGGTVFAALQFMVFQLLVPNVITARVNSIISVLLGLIALAGLALHYLQLDYLKEQDQS